MEKVSPLLLIDASYFVHRTFHAVPGRPNSKGLMTNAIRGTMHTLERVMREKQPSHVACLFDTKTPTFRHELSPEYKANRLPTAPELLEQLPYIHKLIAALGIPLFVRSGVEADDLIGSLTQMAEDRGQRVLIATGDKDMAQLVNDNVFLEDTFRGIQFDRKHVFAKFGVYPNQIVDYLTLMGDSSDGIPGVPGIGLKTASKLLQDYGSIDNILSNLSNMSGHIAESIRNNIDRIKLNKQLTTIVKDLKVVDSWDELKPKEVNKDELRKLYKELEFVHQLDALNNDH